jgi:hypothetical protein
VSTVHGLAVSGWPLPGVEEKDRAAHHWCTDAVVTHWMPLPEPPT